MVVCFFFITLGPLFPKCIHYSLFLLGISIDSLILIQNINSVLHAKFSTVYYNSE
jgi:hypothetical protein